MSEQLEILLKQAKSISDQGNETQARDILIDILQQQPDYVPAMLMLAGSFFTDARYADAEIVYQKLVDELPTNGSVSTALFNCLWKQNKKTEGLAEIKRFLQTADHKEEADCVRHYLKFIQQL